MKRAPAMPRAPTSRTPSQPSAPDGCGIPRRGGPSSIVPPGAAGGFNVGGRNGTLPTPATPVIELEASSGEPEDGELAEIPELQPV
jgi:hypothetical protein